MLSNFAIVCESMTALILHFMEHRDQYLYALDNEKLEIIDVGKVEFCFNVMIRNVSQRSWMKYGIVSLV